MFSSVLPLLVGGGRSSITFSPSRLQDLQYFGKTVTRYASFVDITPCFWWKTLARITLGKHTQFEILLAVAAKHKHRNRAWRMFCCLLPAASRDLPRSYQFWYFSLLYVDSCTNFSQHFNLTSPGHIDWLPVYHYCIINRYTAPSGVAALLKCFRSASKVAMSWQLFDPLGSVIWQIG